MLTHIITVSQPREAGDFLVRLLSKQEISGIELQRICINVTFHAFQVPALTIIRYMRCTCIYIQRENNI